MNTEIDYEELEMVYQRVYAATFGGTRDSIRAALRAVVAHITPLLQPRLAPITTMPLPPVRSGCIRVFGCLRHDGEWALGQTFEGGVTDHYADIAFPISTDPVREEFEAWWSNADLPRPNIGTYEKDIAFAAFKAAKSKS